MLLLRAPQILEPWLQSRPHNDFFTTYEDFTDTLLKYYGIPSLSMRNFIHQVQPYGCIPLLRYHDA